MHVDKPLPGLKDVVVDVQGTICYESEHDDGSTIHEDYVYEMSSPLKLGNKVETYTNIQLSVTVPGACRTWQ